MIFSYLEDINRNLRSLDKEVDKEVRSANPITASRSLVKLGNRINNLAMQAQVQFKHTNGLSRCLELAQNIKEKADSGVTAVLSKVRTPDGFNQRAKSFAKLLGSSKVYVAGNVARVQTDSGIYLLMQEKDMYGVSASKGLTLPDSCSMDIDQALTLTARLVGANVVYYRGKAVPFDVCAFSKGPYITYFSSNRMNPIIAREIEHRFKAKWQLNLVETKVQGNTIEFVHVPGIDDEHIRNI